jgi:hypothetical protein
LFAACALLLDNDDEDDEGDDEDRPFVLTCDELESNDRDVLKLLSDELHGGDVDLFRINELFWMPNELDVVPLLTPIEVDLNWLGDEGDGDVDEDEDDEDEELGLATAASCCWAATSCWAADEREK